MMKVSCARCGRALCVALTTREVESGEVARRLCPERCVGDVTPRVPPERKRRPKEDGGPIGSIRSSLDRIDRELGEAAVVTAGPKLTPKPALTDRFDEAELLAGLAEYRAMEASASELARRWSCEPEDVYALDLKWNKRAAAPKQVKPVLIEQAQELRESGETRRYIADATGLNASGLLTDIATPGMEQAGREVAEEPYGQPKKEGLKVENKPNDSAAPESVEAGSAKGVEKMPTVPRRIPKDIREKVREMNEAGRPHKEIMEQTGLSIYILRRVIAESAAKLPDKTKAVVTSESVDLMREQLISRSYIYDRALKAVDVLLENDGTEPDQLLRDAAAALLAAVGIKDA